MSIYLDAFDENDLCDAWMGLPIEFFNPGPDFGLLPADDLWRHAVNNMARPGDVANLVLERDALRAALTILDDDVESGVDFGCPWEDPNNNFHESVMAARKALGL